MAARESVNLSLKADISDLKRSLGEIPGVTKKEAAKMTRELQTQYNKATRAAQKAAKATKTSWADAGRGAAQVGAAVAGAAVAVVAFGQHMADLNNQLTDTATVSTLAVEQIAGIKLAAEGSGVAFAQVEKGLRALPKAMNDAADGTGAAADAFDDLGVSVRDASTGGLRDASELLPEIFAGLNALPDQASKSAAAMDIFGAKAGGALVQSGAIENLDAFVALADEFGISTGPKASAAAAEFQRQMATLKVVTEGTLAKTLDQFGGAGGLNDVIGVATGAVIVMGSVFESVFGELNTQIQNVVGPLTEVALRVIDGDMVGALKAAKRNAAELGEGLSNVFVPVAAVRMAAAVGDGLADGYLRAKKAAEEFEATVGGGGGGGDRDDESRDTPTSAATTAGTNTAIKDLDRLRAAQAKASEARLSERARIQLTFEREIEVIAQAMEAGANMEEAQTAINVAQTEQLIALAELKERLHTEDMERMRAEQEQARQTSMAIVGDAADAVGALSGLASTAGAAMAQAGSKGAKKSAQIMFGVSKALAVSMIPLKLAEALMAAQSRPLPGLATATALATAASQTVAVASAKPPTFDRGGIIHGGTGDQVMAATLPGEAVLSRGAVAAIGEDGVNDLNRGRMPQGPTVVQMVYRHRIFDEFVQDNMSAPSPLGQAVRGDRVTGRRS